MFRLGEVVVGRGLGLLGGRGGKRRGSGPFQGFFLCFLFALPPVDRLHAQLAKQVPLFIDLKGRPCTDPRFWTPPGCLLYALSCA